MSDKQVTLDDVAAAVGRLGDLNEQQAAEITNIERLIWRLASSESDTKSENQVLLPTVWMPR